ncbi:AMP-binding protein [Dactylosporangium sp. NPDC000555]|uniref:AMP-binding protein n=1 Tax=Dactylosporangium sp. NPDC000555 TaxID=3154260 RepID=UPI0033219C1E
MTDSVVDPRPGVTTWVTREIRAEFEREGHWTKATWLDLLRRPLPSDGVAVVDETGALTRAEVMRKARRLAAYLHRSGVARGDVVTLAVPNWREFVVIHAAVGLVGGVVNPVLPRVGRNELRHVLSTARSRLVFAAAENRGSSPYRTAVEASDGLDHVIEIISVRGGERPYEGIVDDPAYDVGLPEVVVEATDWDTITFTSGTESLPKAAVHSHQSTMFGLRSFITGVLGLDAGDGVFMPSPLCHASGIQWGLRTALYAGVPLVLQDKWDPGVALDLIDTHGCTYTLAATPFILDLIEAQRRRPRSGRSLRYLGSGGAPIPRHLGPAVREAFGAELISVFGASETYITTTTLPGMAGDLQASDGVALPGVSVRIVDELGEPLPRGREGEIVTRGPQVFLGYLGDAELTRSAFDGEWYHFGDLGVIDEAGMLRVTGRIKDIVIRGGENISVREVEELLIVHPAIESVAIVGYPDARLGERCCAVLVLVEGEQLSLAEVCAYLTERGLAKFKLPERVEIVESMPMTTTGKIRKSELRRQFAEQDSR